MKLSKPQKRLGPRAFLLCVLMVDLIAQFPIDLYAPALPVMKAEFGVNEALLNLTMFIFFLGSAISIVIAGPLMDRRGRKPVFVSACLLLLIGSVGCALSPNVWVLIVFRLVQACGYGFSMTTVSALIQDSFEGEDVKLAQTLVQSLIIVGPAVAPFIGSALLVAIGWRGIFWFLTAVSFVALLFALPVSETLSSEHRTHGTIAASLGQSMRNARPLFSDKAFVATALIIGLGALPYFAWIATVSYDIIDFFGGTYFDYSLCYAATTMVTLVAPFVYLAMSKRFGAHLIFKVCFALFIVTALLVGGVGMMNPLLFTVAFFPFALGEGIMRPMGFVLLLNQKPESVSSASMVANFTYSVLMSVGTVLGTLPWSNFISGLAILTAISFACMIALYLWGVRSYRLTLDE